MGCGCKKSKPKRVRDPIDVMGGYKHLKPHQIRSRLEIFKKHNCKDCKDRHKCDYTRYLGCKGNVKPKVS